MSGTQKETNKVAFIENDEQVLSVANSYGRCRIGTVTSSRLHIV